MRKQWLLLLWLLLAGLCAPVQAQDASAPDEEETRWYRIEVLLFERQAAADDGEVLQLQARPQRTTGMIVPAVDDTLLRAPDIGGAVAQLMPPWTRPATAWPAAAPVNLLAGIHATSLTGWAPPRIVQNPAVYHYHNAAAEQRLLVNARRRLFRHPDFTVLAHHSWYQAFAPELEPLPVQLDLTAGTRGRGFSAWVSVRLSRFLHLDTEMNLLVDRDNDGWVSHSASQRMRSNELYYIDHPLMGMLATAEPWAPPGDSGEPLDQAPGTSTPGQFTSASPARTPAPSQ